MCIRDRLYTAFEYYLFHKPAGCVSATQDNMHRTVMAYLSDTAREMCIRDRYIDGCKTQTFSSSQIIVNREEMEELLNELRIKTPEEIKRYQKIISNKRCV